MGYLGYKPADKPLTSADITDSVITSAKIVDGTIAIADLSATGSPGSTTFLRGDNTWGSAGAAAGQVIQVLSATDSTSRTTTSLSFVTASNTLSVTITPSSVSNKILIILSGNFNANEIAGTVGTIYRGATNLGTSAYGMNILYNGGGGISAGFTISYLDSPATTSATTYQFYFRQDGAGGSAYLNASGSRGSITCMEIKG